MEFTLKLKYLTSKHHDLKQALTRMFFFFSQVEEVTIKFNEVKERLKIKPRPALVQTN